jgi:hypothetical protein
MPDEPQPAETFRARAERIRMFEITADPHARALAEGESLVGITLTPNETFMLNATYTKAVWVALLDLCDQLDERLGREIKPE